MKQHPYLPRDRWFVIISWLYHQVFIHSDIQQSWDVCLYNMETRKDDNLLDFGGLVCTKTNPLDLSVAEQLPTTQYVFSRYFTLLAEKHLRLHNKKDVVIHELSLELRNIWIFMNFTPDTRYKKKVENCCR